MECVLSVSPAGQGKKRGVKKLAREGEGGLVWGGGVLICRLPASFEPRTPFETKHWGRGRLTANEKCAGSSDLDWVSCCS